MDCTDVIERLPWLLNGTLEETERDEVAAHLAGCDGCRRELAATAEVLATAGGHPPAGLLVSWVLDEAGAAAPAIEEHVASCAACAEEVALLRENRSLAVLVPRPTGVDAGREPGAVRRWRRTAVAAAAVAVMSLAAMLVLLVSGPSGSDGAAPGGLLAGAGLAVPQANVPVLELLPSSLTLRGGDAVAELPGDASLAVVLLVLPSQPPATRYRATLRDAAGAVVANVDGLVPSPTGDLTVSLAPARLPAGELRLELAAAADGRSEPVADYRLRVVRD